MHAQVRVSLSVCTHVSGLRAVLWCVGMYEKGGHKQTHRHANIHTCKQCVVRWCVGMNARAHTNRHTDTQTRRHAHIDTCTQRVVRWCVGMYAGVATNRHTDTHS